MNTAAPNPEHFLSLLREQQRGRLKVYLGFAPGVGKTYEMLQEGQRLKRQGVDVVIGLVETHGRPETVAQLGDLEQVSRKRVEYRGVVLEEMDLEAVLRRRPTVVLVDELAHTNAPGCKNAKRYQDVEEILNAGIDVYTTMNVQHIESRADLVQQITGVAVRETVPDSLLELSDQIELIDLSPPELLKRLKDGKVYLDDGASRAAENFFKEEHLTALRELALRFTAEKVDDELKDYMTMKQILGPWNTKEKLLVATLQHMPCLFQRCLPGGRRPFFCDPASAGNRSCRSSPGEGKFRRSPGRTGAARTASRSRPRAT